MYPNLFYRLNKTFVYTLRSEKFCYALFVFKYTYSIPTK